LSTHVTLFLNSSSFQVRDAGGLTPTRGYLLGLPRCGVTRTQHLVRVARPSASCTLKCGVCYAPEGASMGEQVHGCCGYTRGGRAVWLFGRSVGLRLRVGDALTGGAVCAQLYLQQPRPERTQDSCWWFDRVWILHP
jgi:hypothetical protein